MPNRPLHELPRLLCWALGAVSITAVPAAAVTVDGLYSAEVEMPEQGSTDAAFERALDRVVVKVTGLSEPEAAAVALPGDAASLVRQYRNTEPGSIEVGFDPAALRERLDAAGLPVWGEDRPLVLLWLAMDAGRGEREILAAAEADADTAPPVPGNEDPAPLRQLLLDTAGDRGLPMMLPLVDSVDLGSVSFADLWGDFTEPVLEASARYGADAILIGRSRGPDPATSRVRWTLLIGDERMDWQGDMTAGPHGATDRLAARLAATADDSRLIRVEVSGIDSLRAYGTVFNYLEELGVVEHCRVERVDGDRVLFGLRVRGDPDRLMRSIALRRLLTPVDDPGAGPLVESAADLHYEMVDG